MNNKQEIIKSFERALAFNNKAVREAKVAYDEMVKSLSDASEKEEEYNRGLNDCWKLLKKICSSVENGGIDHNDLYHIFGSYRYTYIFANFTPQEALEKIRVWERKKAEEEAKPKIGDVVEIQVRRETATGSRMDVLTGIVLNNTEINLYYMDSHGNLATEQYTENVHVKKTGEHVDILSVLNK